MLVEKILGIIRLSISEVSPVNRFKEIKLPSINSVSERLIVSIGKNALVQAYAFNLSIRNNEIYSSVNTSYLIHQVVGYYDGTNPNLQQFIKLKQVDLYLVPHPQPEFYTFNSTEKTIERLSSLSSSVLVIFLISGGGSAAFALPEFSFTSSQYLSIVSNALRAGFDIFELNYLRTLIDQVKGGKTLEKITASTVLTWITSDVIPDIPQIVASGPTSPGIQNQIPSSSKIKIDGWLQSNYKINTNILNEKLNQLQQKLLDSGIFHKSRIITTRTDLITVFAQKLVHEGFHCKTMDSNLVGEVDHVASIIVSDIIDNRHLSQQILLWAGEPTITLTAEAVADGNGGRASSLSVLIAEKLFEKNLKNVGFVSIATDGKDGSSISPIYAINYQEAVKLQNIGSANDIVYGGTSSTVLESLQCGYQLDFTDINLLDIYLAILT